MVILFLLALTANCSPIPGTTTGDVMNSTSNNIWILQQDSSCANALDLGLTLNEDENYYQYLLRRQSDRDANHLNSALIPRRVSRIRDPFHNILVFKRHMFDSMPSADRIYTTIPNHIRECVPNIIGPIGTSDCLSEHAYMFTQSYNELYGPVTTHNFTDRLTEFLTTYNCGRTGIPSGFCTTEECNNKIRSFRESLCAVTAFYTYMYESDEFRDDLNKTAQLREDRSTCIAMAQ